MTSLEQAIKDAVEKGGYCFPFVKQYYTKCEDDTGCTDHEIKSFLLDPAFWQALGKARGWTADFEEADGTTYNKWKVEMHNLIDHLASGKDVESFFETLV